MRRKASPLPVPPDSGPSPVALAQLRADIRAELTAEFDAALKARLTAAQEAFDQKLGVLAADIKASIPPPQQVDINGIIQGVAKVLDPTISQVATDAVKKVWQENSKAFLAEIGQALPKAAVAVAPVNGVAPSPQGQTNPGGDFLSQLLANLPKLLGEGLDAYLKFKKANEPDDAYRQKVMTSVADQFGLMFKFHNILNRWEQNKGSTDEVTNEISKLLVPGPKPSSSAG